MTQNVATSQQDRHRTPRATWPDWVPEEVRRYVFHTGGGRPIRALAREAGCHPSTILRQVRRFETRRDDPLIDRGLDRLQSWVARSEAAGARGSSDRGTTDMNFASDSRQMPDDATLTREARRVLRRLTEPRACLAVARDMEKAVVVRDGPDGKTVRTGVVDRAVAEAMALRDWISADVDGRITRYVITSTGRAALKRLLATEKESDGDAYAAQHRDFEEREVGAPGARRSVRVNVCESPLSALARRRGPDGKPFLDATMVAAGERLREDFELAQMGPRVAQNWDRFLTGGDRGGMAPGSGPIRGPENARRRLADALSHLGPGLGDAVLRVCCFLEGMEAVERRLGWSARSGKVVLRIALARLARYYDEEKDGWSPLIG